MSDLKTGMDALRLVAGADCNGTVTGAEAAAILERLEELRQLLEDLGIPALVRMASEKEARGEQRIPCFLQVEYVERLRIAMGYDKVGMAAVRHGDEVSPDVWALWKRSYGLHGARRLASTHGMRPRE